MMVSLKDGGPQPSAAKCFNSLSVGELPALNQ